MSNYGITGWSGGPRQSLTHNLKAGQFRGMGRTNIFPSTTVVNNNFFGNGYGIYDDCCCNNNNSTPSWMNWMMGIGLGTSLLGNILGMFGIGGGGGGVSDTEGGGGSEKSTKTTKETKEVSKLDEAQKQIKDLGKQYSISVDSDGNIVFKYKDDNGNEYEGKNIGELNQNVFAGIKNAQKKAQPATAKDTTAKSETVANNEVTTDFKDGSTISVIDQKLGDSSKIQGTVTNNKDGTISIKDNKYTYTYKKTGTVTYNGKEYPKYSLTGATDNSTNNSASITKQDYILVDGQLIQPKNINPKLLNGLGTGSIKK